MRAVAQSHNRTRNVHKQNTNTIRIAHKCVALNCVAYLLSAYHAATCDWEKTQARRWLRLQIRETSSSDSLFRHTSTVHSRGYNKSGIKVARCCPAEGKRALPRFLHVLHILNTENLLHVHVLKFTTRHAPIRLQYTACSHFADSHFAEYHYAESQIRKTFKNQQKFSSVVFVSLRPLNLL